MSEEAREALRRRIIDLHDECAALVEEVSAIQIAFSQPRFALGSALLHLRDAKFAAEIGEPK